MVEQRHHAHHDRGVAGGAEQLVPLEVRSGVAAGRLPAGDGLVARRQARKAGDAEGHHVVTVEEEVPRKVLHGIAGGDHLPVEDRRDALVVAEDHVAESGVAPAQRRPSDGGGTVASRSSKARSTAG